MLILTEVLVARYRSNYVCFGVVKALDKIRFESLTDKSKLESQPELFIRIVPDKVNRTLSIIDSGVGMTKSGILSPQP